MVGRADLIYTMKPRFLGIGAQRAATTWIYEVLRAHPQTYLPDTKEIHFFDENYSKGLEWYLEHFREAKPGSFGGEITPNYLNQPDAAARIARDLPDVRLFAILREPVSRARSSYELLRHRFPNQTFAEACRPGSYLVDLGLYGKHLKRFYEFFEPSRIHIILYEDLTKDPHGALQGLYRFLGIDHDAPPATAAKSTNSVLFPKSQAFLRRVGAGPVVNFAKRGQVGDCLRMLGQRLKGFHRRQGDDSSLRRLFEDDIKELEGLISKDLHHWMNP